MLDKGVQTFCALVVSPIVLDIWEPLGYGPQRQCANPPGADQADRVAVCSRKVARRQRLHHGGTHGTDQCALHNGNGQPMDWVVEDDHRVGARQAMLRVDVGAGDPFHPLPVEGRAYVR